MITATQILAHLWGDYILQSDWMAQNKTKAWSPAACHATVYSLLFLLFQPSPLAFATILGTHLLIDRFRLARYVVWAKNFLGPKCWSAYSMAGGDSPIIYNPSLIAGTKWLRNLPWERCSKTGYAETAPDWLAFWLLIIADNILHLTINGLALKYL